MELNEKLLQLRKQKGLTQEALADALFVSRTAISKWESGRGYPNIDSLKAIAQYFGITVDQLLSSEELLTLAEHDQKQKERHFRDLVFGLLDCSTALCLFLPLFGQRTGGSLENVSLLRLTSMAPYLRVAYYIAVVGMLIWGICTLAFRNGQWKSRLSLFFNVAVVGLFMISLQPYAAILVFLFLIIKVLLLIKPQ